jgi:type III restriction enzyme
LIVVCDNSDIADVFYRHISGESESDEVTLEEVEAVESEEDDESEAEPVKRGKSKAKRRVVYGPSRILPEFANTAERKYTMRIDVKMLKEAESEDPEKTKQKAAEELRRVVATVGKVGEPGEHIRCVVSVAMLTEGWDANNVTHILGIRAFRSQLLCEQVVGRGLRRMNYHPERDDEGRLLLPEEYVDVYGIPFTVIPYKARAEDKAASEDKPKNRIWALPDREELELRFPRVEGYHFRSDKALLTCDVAGIDPITIDPKLEPTETFIQAAVGYNDTPVEGQTPFAYVRQDRSNYYAQTHLQTILFLITQEIINELQDWKSADKRARVMRLKSRHQLFPQVFSFVQQFVRTRVEFNGVDPRELGLEKYARLVVERVRDAINANDSDGEPLLLPLLNRYRPVGTTRDVDFVTTRSVVPADRSHINAVVLHSGWEGQAATLLDSRPDLVQWYARNDHLGLQIPYEYLESDHTYEPDFIVLLKNGLMLILEIKGYEGREPERTNAKHAAAQRWVMAVNNGKEFGRWGFLVCREVERLLTEIGALQGVEVAPARLPNIERSLFEREDAERGVVPERKRALPGRLVEPTRETRFVTCVPVLSLQVAASGFGEGSPDLAETTEWMEWSGKRTLREGMFVAQVTGRSMEPRIPDGAWCLFQGPVTGTRNGRIVLVRLRDAVDPDSQEKFTVKQYSSVRVASDEGEEGEWRHEVIQLSPINREFAPMEFRDNPDDRLQVVAEFLEVVAAPVAE